MELDAAKVQSQGIWFGWIIGELSVYALFSCPLVKL